jgi:hypothetical protein
MILLSKGFAKSSKRCQITERIRRDNIYNDDLSSRNIKIVIVRLHLSKESGFQK